MQSRDHRGRDRVGVGGGREARTDHLLAEVRGGKPSGRETVKPTQGQSESLHKRRDDRRGGRAIEKRREATERAFEIHDAIRDHFRSNPNENLGGLVIMASITDTALLEDDESVDEDDLAAGRLAVVTATLTFRGRS